MKKLTKKDIEDILSLTPMQEGMLFHYLREPASDIYFEQLSLSISGKIDIKTFKKSWDVVVEANEMLRVVFRWEKIENPIQIILKEHTLQSLYYYPGKSTIEKKKWLEEIKVRDRKDKFDLRSVPFRVTLCKLEEDEYEMIISNHHILYDGWSNGIVLREFFNAYNSMSKGEELVKPVKRKFKEFIKWNQRQDNAEGGKFWQNYLKGFQTPTRLCKKKIKEKEITAVENLRIQLSKDIKIQLDRMVKEYKLTLASIMYSAWGLLLGKYNSSDDVIFGTTVAGRSANVEGIEEIIGLFINTIPFRLQANPDQKIEDLIRQVDKILQARQEYENVSLVNIKEYSEIKNNEEFFDSIVIIENYPLERLLKQLNLSSLSIHSYSLMEAAHYDLTIFVKAFFDCIEFIFSYHKEAFDEAYILRLPNHFRCVVQYIIENCGNRVSDIVIIPEKEKKKILYDFNNTHMDYPKDRIINDFFEKQVEKIPDNTALIFKNSHLTYRDLNEKVNQMTSVLREKGVKPDIIVGIMVERSLEMLVGLLGILKAGGAYLPIDPQYPKKRIEYMLKDSTAPILLTQTGLMEKVEEMKDAGENIDILEPSSYKTGKDTLDNISAFSDLAYVIYTSGSTGKPKGVTITHRNVINFINGMVSRINFSAAKIILALTTISFDIFVLETFLPLLNGLKVIIAAEQYQRDPQLLADALIKNNVNMLQVTPSSLKLLLNNDRDLTCLEKIGDLMIGGEPFIEDLLEVLKTKFKGKIYNLYGPTETTVWSAFRNLTDAAQIDIGSPISNTQIYIVDRHWNLQPIAVAGELCIGGDGVGRGYLNKPELTAGSFVISYSRLSPNDRLYKTGDLARWLADGNIEFLGRLDHQIKVRGYRIELGEIESQLLRHKGIKEAVAAIKEDRGGDGDRFVCAYIVPNILRSDQTFDVSGFREYLLKFLPDYMIPSFVMEIDKIPLTPNGKVDRNSLPTPEIVSGSQYVPPRNKIEEKLVEIWSEVLGTKMDKTGIKDNFFDLGGHSLKALLFITKVHKELDVKIPLGQLFKTPFIKELSSYIKESVKNKYYPIEPVEKKDYYWLSSAQKRLYVLQQMELENTAYNMPQFYVLSKEIDITKLEGIFEKLIRFHESLRTSFHVVGNEPMQKVHDKVYFSIENYRVDAVEKLEGAMKPFVRPFDLSQAPLIRVGLMKVQDEQNILLLDIHHIISDAVSLEILLRDFLALSEKKLLPPLCIRYKDFSEWQNSEKERNKIKQQETYWLKEFEGKIPLLNLPTDYVRPDLLGFKGSTVSFQIDRAMTEKIKTKALQMNVTLMMFLLSVYKILLAKYTVKEDIVVGTVIAGRQHADLESIIGFFVNMLAIRTQPNQSKTFSDYLTEIKEKTLNAYENQGYQFEELVDKLNIPRHPGKHRLVNVVFVLRDEAQQRVLNKILAKNITHFDFREISHFDLMLHATAYDDSISVILEYSTTLFKEKTIKQLSKLYLEILEQVLADGTIRLGEISINHQFVTVESNVLQDSQHDFNF